MILFIHGFASCGLGRKSELLRAHFGASQVLAPDLPSHPTEAIDRLESLLEAHEIKLLVGSSLGAYFATWLNRKRSLPAVLVNPAIAPFLLLQDYLGTHRGCNGKPIRVEPETLSSLCLMHRPRLREDERYLVLLQTGDEILDYRQAATYYAAKDVVVEPGGSHRFENFSDHLPRITTWAREHEQNR